MSTLDDSSDSNHNEFDPDKIGIKLQSFYISLRDSDFQEIARNMSIIENHMTNNLAGETDDIINEIKRDCQTKAVQFYRASLGDSIRTLITTNRKKMSIKPSAADSSGTYNQRHLLALIDLLGNWSNYISDLTNLDLSISIIRIIVPQLHIRIKEMMIEIFNQFKQDKNLITLQTQLLSYQNNTSSSSSNTRPPTTTSNITTGQLIDFSSLPISINQLDNILCQLVSFRETIYHYYKFLNTILLPPSSSDSISDARNPASCTPTTTPYTPAPTTTHTPTTSPPPSTNNTIHNSTTALSPNIFRPSSLSLPTTHILNEHLYDWRELDIIYITLEYSYLHISIQYAIQYNLLLEIQYNIYIPQCIEDYLFIIKKIIQRSITTNIYNIIHTISIKIIEYFEYNADNTHDNMCILYTLISHKRWYTHSYTTHTIHLPKRFQISPSSNGDMAGTTSQIQSKNSPSGAPMSRQTPPTSQNGTNMYCVIILCYIYTHDNECVLA